jgi:flagellar motor switch/type III secretory pathway protein FliN
VISAAGVKPFPWHALERTTPSDVSALRAVRRWAAVHVDLSRLTAVLTEMLGAETAVLVRRAQALTEARGLVGGAGVVVARADAPDIERAMLVEAEFALVATAVARVAKRDPPVVLDTGASASVSAAGALAAMVVAALRHAHAGLATRILAAGPAPVLEADMARLGPELLAVTLTVLVADEAYEARLVVPRSATMAAPPSPWSEGALTALGVTPLSIPVVAHALTATATEVASLQPGDVLVLEGWALVRAKSGSLAGVVHLSAPASTEGVLADLGDDGRLVLRGDLVPLSAAEADMGDAIDKGGLIEAIGEIPVLVRVEIGQARMAAREWAALGRGDVVVLDRHVGESVVLRVGGIPVARGDLVEVDGAIGVRIVERTSSEQGVQR